MPLQVKKKDGRIEDFMDSKLIAGVQKAGATSEQAALVAKEVKDRLVGRELVTTEELSAMVVPALARVNPAASAAFVKYRAEKALKAKKKPKAAKAKKAKKTKTAKKAKKTKKAKKAKKTK
jgi:transcriptional regulator NrdR family protein